MNIIIKTIHSVNNGVNFLTRSIERTYIKITYAHVINNLSIHKSEPEYEPLGVYVTMKKKPPFNYRKHLKSFKCDEHNIRRYFHHGKPYYNCILIAQQGLTEYGYWLFDKQESHMKYMSAVANWFENNQTADGIWEFEYDFYNANVSATLPAPWVSAMGQGQAISFLCRYAILTSNEKYFEIAERALEPFNKTVDQCGVVAYIGGFPMYEEYPSIPPSFTLNGFVYALFGLYDLSILHNSSQAKELFDKGMKTLEYVLPLYDDSKLTYYDLGYLTARTRKPRQNSKYHLLHIKLMKSLYTITKSEIVRFYADKWERQ